MDTLRLKAGSNFKKCVKGYHMLNDSPITGRCWEDINSIVLTTSGYQVHNQSDGSHKSGKDITSSLGDLSNKSAKYTRGNKPLKISSYRLGKISSAIAPGDVKDIVTAINDKKNFEFYSVIARAQTKKNLHYDWYLIPSDFPALDPRIYEWRHTYGRDGKMSGWETNTINGSCMSVRFSLASELWISLNLTDEVKNFIVSSCDVNIGKQLNYIQFYEDTVDNLPLINLT